MNDVFVDDKLLVVGYFLARCTDYTGSIVESPPKSLKVENWTDAYELFFPALSGGRTYPQFAMLLNSLRDTFDSILDTYNRRGFGAPNTTNSGPKNPKSDFLREENIHWIWKDRSDDDLTNHVLALSRVTISSVKIKRQNRTQTKTLISINPAARAALRQAIKAHPKWSDFKWTTRKLIINFSRDDFIAACDALNLDILAVIKSAEHEPPSSSKKIPASLKLDPNKVVGKFEPVTHIIDDPNKPNWTFPKDIMDPDVSTTPVIAQVPKGVLNDLTNLSLPREVAKHPTSGEPIIANNGQDGPYLKHGKTYVFLGTEDKVLEIGANRAIDLIIDAESSPDPEAGLHPLSPPLCLVQKSPGGEKQEKKKKDDRVESLFSDIVNNIADEIIKMNSNGASLFGISQYSEAKKCAEVGEKLQSFRRKVENIKLEWISLVEEKTS